VVDEEDATDVIVAVGEPSEFVGVRVTVLETTTTALLLEPLSTMVEVVSTTEVVP